MIVAGLLKFIVVLAILYLGYQLILKHMPFGSGKETFESPALALLPPNLPTEVYAGPREIVASGPSPPSQSAPEGEVMVMPPTQALDPYAESQEGANAPERLRNPERMFRPAPNNDAVNAIEDSGIGGMAQQATSNSMQTFAPDFAQNGGSFMGGVFANDTDIPTNFSDF
jgi:hypothetical protein